MSALALRPPVSFRKLVPAEQPLIEAHLGRLGAEDLRSRFMGSAPATRSIIASAALSSPLAIGCFVKGQLRALGELYPASTALAELALSVEGPFQNRGIGTAILGRLVVAARNRGYRRCVVYCFSDNLRMRRIAQLAGGEVVRDGNEAAATIMIASANPATFALELLDELSEVVDRWIDLAQAIWSHHWVGLAPDLPRL